MDEIKTKVPPEISAYMSKLGKKAGAVNKQKGSAYFKWVRSHGKKKSEEAKEDLRQG